MRETRRQVLKALQIKETDCPLLRGPLLVIVHFQLPAPKLTRKRALFHRKPHIKKPDGDNLEKFLNDALNKTIWADDANIVWLLRSKTYTSEKIGRTIIYATEINDDVPDYADLIAQITENISLEGYGREEAIA